MQVTLIDTMGSDLSVVNAARVSFDKQSDWERRGCDRECRGDSACWGCSGSTPRLSDRDRKLIHYLAKHQHKSPFNHAFASFRVSAPIFVARQLVKHEYLPWNEVSRRYVDSPPDFYFPGVWRKRATDKKQGSSDDIIGVLDDHRYGHATSPHTAYAELIEHIEKVYTAFLKSGVCPEQARMVLPQSMMTEWIWSGSVFAFAKMCKLRLDAHSQVETQRIAALIDNQMRDYFPVSWQALMEN